MVGWTNIAEIAEGVNSGKLSAIDLVNKSLHAINEDKDLDAIISTTEVRARECAARIDKQVSLGKNAGKLAGVPFIAKDNFLTFGGRTTAASNMLKSFEAPYQATAIEKLEAEGAICVAKANLDAFAHGSSTENSDFFVTKNPHDKSRVPGGSSGGSAAAVAAGLAPFAIGTDTGGSIRQPASFTGIVGYKPTYGLISRSGIVAMASSTDVVGTLTKSSEDAAVVVGVMAGQDPLDSTTIKFGDQDYSNLDYSLKGKKIGVIREYMGDGLDDEIKNSVDEMIDKLRTTGADVSEVSMPSLPLALAVYYIICPAEVSSNLARYDGQRYGHSAKESVDLNESYELSREQGFGAEAKRRIMIGTHVLSSGHYDAFYKKAQTVRTKIINEFTHAFSQYDFLVGPTTPTVAFKIGEKSGDPLQMYLNDILTVAANISGNPSISLPAPTASGLPIGFQMIAGVGLDKQLLSAANAIEELSK